MPNLNYNDFKDGTQGGTQDTLNLQIIGLILSDFFDTILSLPDTFGDKEDETEMVIRILSFGPMIKVTAPRHFIDLIKQRLMNQKSCEQ